MIKKFFKKYFNKIKKRERDKIYFALDTVDQSARYKLKNILTSKEAASVVRSGAKSIVTLYKSSWNVFSITLRSFRYRSIIFWFVFMILMAVVSIFFIRAVVFIVQNPSTFSQSSSNNKQNYITFAYSADGLLNKYYANDHADYTIDNNKLAGQAKTLVTSEVTSLILGAKWTQMSKKVFSISDYTFTSDATNYSVNVSGSFDAITYLTSIEQKYYWPIESKNIVTVTDQYGRPMFYGEDYYVSKDKTKMLMDPTQMMSPTFTMHTRNVSQQNSALDGKSLWEIAGNGKYWGREMKGSVFSSATLDPSTNDKFDHLTLTLSDDGFFTAFTQYLNIILSIYKYHHQNIGKIYSKDFSAKKGAHYKENVNPKTDDDINNIYIQSLQLYQPLLIWINQEAIFTVTHSRITRLAPISYTFTWSDTPIGEAFKQATHNYVFQSKSKDGNSVNDGDKERSPGDLTKNADLDPTGNYWFYDKNYKYPKDKAEKQWASGFTSDTIVPNFLDLGFDHLTSFALDITGLANAKKDDDSKKPKDDVQNKFTQQTWYQTILLPYKNATGELPDADYSNPNYNQAHIFRTATSWFSIAYGQTDASVNGRFADRTEFKHDKNTPTSKKPDSYPFRITPDHNKDGTLLNASPYPSYYGNISSDGKRLLEQTADRRLVIARQVNQASGLIGVVTVDPEANEKDGIKKISFKNPTNPKLTDDNKHDYYGSANWGVFIPKESNSDYKPPKGKSKLAPSETQKSLQIADYYSLAVSKSVNLTVTFSNGIRYINTDTTFKAINISMIVVGLIFLMGFFLYLVIKYRLLSILIVIFSTLFFMLTIIFLTNARMALNYENISIICFGLMLLIISIDISVAVFRQRVIAFLKNATDKLIISKGMIVLFLNYFALVFIESILLASKFGKDTLAVALILMGAMTVLIFLLVPFFLIFYFQSIVVNKKYKKDIDKITFKIAQLAKFSHLEKLIHKRGFASHIEGRQQLLNYLAESHENALTAQPQEITNVAALSYKQNASSDVIKQSSLENDPKPTLVSRAVNVILLAALYNKSSFPENEFVTNTGKSDLPPKAIKINAFNIILAAQIAKTNQNTQAQKLFPPLSPSKQETAHENNN